jgi:hypothetical protein
MNTSYIVRMIGECVETFHIEKSKRVCDLDSSNVLLLLLSTPTARHWCSALATPAEHRL